MFDALFVWLTLKPYNSLSHSLFLFVRLFKARKEDMNTVFNTDKFHPQSTTIVIKNSVKLFFESIVYLLCKFLWSSLLVSKWNSYHACSDHETTNKLNLNPTWLFDTKTKIRSTFKSWNIIHCVLIEWQRKTFWMQIVLLKLNKCRIKGRRYIDFFVLVVSLSFWDLLCAQFRNAHCLNVLTSITCKR